MSPMKETKARFPLFLAAFLLAVPSAARANAGTPRKNGCGKTDCLRSLRMVM